MLNRANGRLRLFKKAADFGAFQAVLAEAQERVPLRILGYVTMSNHCHFVVWPRRGRVERNPLRAGLVQQAEQWCLGQSVSRGSGGCCCRREVR